MAETDKIKFLFQEISRLENKARPILHLFGQEKRLTQLNRLSFELDGQIISLLKTTDQHFRYKSDENESLLINNEIYFSVSQEENGLFQAQTVEMSANVHGNGFIYGFATLSRFSFLNREARYPRSFIGKINCLGASILTKKEDSFSFFGSRMPEKFLGKIDVDGNFSLEIIDSYWMHDMTSRMKRIIGDPFSGDNAKRKRFLDNQAELKYQLNLFKEDFSRK